MSHLKKFLALGTKMVHEEDTLFTVRVVSFLSWVIIIACASFIVFAASTLYGLRGEFSMTILELESAAVVAAVITVVCFYSWSVGILPVLRRLVDIKVSIKLLYDLLDTYDESVDLKLLSEVEGSYDHVQTYRFSEESWCVEWFKLNHDAPTQHFLSVLVTPTQLKDFGSDSLMPYSIEMAKRLILVRKLIRPSLVVMVDSRKTDLRQRVLAGAVEFGIKPPQNRL